MLGCALYIRCVLSVENNVIVDSFLTVGRGLADAMRRTFWSPQMTVRNLGENDI
jgi:hypothetical protein